MISRVLDNRVQRIGERLEAYLPFASVKQELMNGKNRRFGFHFPELALEMIYTTRQLLEGNELYEVELVESNQKPIYRAVRLKDSPHWIAANMLSATQEDCILSLPIPLVSDSTFDRTFADYLESSRIKYLPDFPILTRENIEEFAARWSTLLKSEIRNYQLNEGHIELEEDINWSGRLLKSFIVRRQIHLSIIHSPRQAAKHIQERLKELIVPFIHSCNWRIPSAGVFVCESDHTFFDASYSFHEGTFEFELVDGESPRADRLLTLYWRPAAAASIETVLTCFISFRKQIKQLRLTENTSFFYGIFSLLPVLQQQIDDFQQQQYQIRKDWKQKALEGDPSAQAAVLVDISLLKQSDDLIPFAQNRDVQLLRLGNRLIVRTLEHLELTVASLQTGHLFLNNYCEHVIAETDYQQLFLDVQYPPREQEEEIIPLFIKRLFQFW